MTLTTTISRYLTQENLEQLYQTISKTIIAEVYAHPFHIFVEVGFILALIFMVLTPRKHHMVASDAASKLSKQEEEELIQEFVSDGFPSPNLPDPDWSAPVITKNEGSRSDVRDWKGENFQGVINTANFDFLALSTHIRMIDTAADTTVEYGIGSCGPRGFYGTLKPHLTLESAIANFLKAPTAIVFSCSFASPSTVIPCFSARGDEIICDEGCNLLNQHGVSLSRSHVTYYRHLDVNHIEEIMIASHKKKRRDLPRRWIVTEGLFRNTGEIAPIDQIVALAKKYKYRVVVDDNVGFGILGKTGRGTPELFNVPLKDIDVYLGSFATGIGSVGGFCVGTEMVTDHQRLGATGYVFSAAACAYSSTCATLALKMLDEEEDDNDDNNKNKKGGGRPYRVQQYAKQFREQVKCPPGITLQGNNNNNNSQKNIVELATGSPCIHFRRNCDLEHLATSYNNFHTNTSSSALAKKSGGEMIAQRKQQAAEAKKSYDESNVSFRKVADAILRRGYLVSRVEFNHEDHVLIPPSLRVNLKSEMTKEEVSELVKIVSEELKREFS